MDRRTVARELVKIGLKQMGPKGAKRALKFYKKNPDAYLGNGCIVKDDKC